MIPSISAARASACLGLGVRAQQPDQPGDLGARHDRDVQREHLVAGAPERRLCCRQHPWVVGPRVVELGHHHRSRHPDVGALAPQHRRDLVDRLVGRGHEQRAVRGPEPGPQLAHEVGVPGGVDEVDLHAAVHDGRHRQRHRASVGALAGLEVGHRGALGDRAGAGQGAAADQQGLQERGLATGARPHQHDVAYLIGLEGLEILSAGCTSSFVRHGDTLLLFRGPPQPLAWRNSQSMALRRRRT